jgi:beta-mannosidase
MVAAGLLEPLEKGNRVYQALNLEYYQWWYRRTFRASPVESGAKAELVFDGLDCLATVWLNGKLVGHAANMLIPHRFDVTRLLIPSQENEILVRIDPAVPAGLAAPRSAWDRADPDHWESLHIRKAPHMYGWDIMPRVISAGMWRDVRLEWSPPVSLFNAYWFTRTVDVERKRAVVSASWEIAEGAADGGKYRLEFALRRNGQTAFRSEVDALSPKGQQEFTLDPVDFWWPRGYGDPALYEATITLRDHRGITLDRHVSRIGIRTVQLDRSDIVTQDNPGAFGFVVNGVSIFVKGTNWVPLDALHSRDTQHLDRVFPMLVELNCNMARCWGGNVYEQDRFFDLCDENGILIWQDFAMAGAAYPQGDVFLNAIAVEVEAVVSRLRNHPSLALWSGNNECDDALIWTNPLGAPPVDPNRDRITREIIPEVLKRLDPDRPYEPSSPYHSPHVFAAGNQAQLMPEVHLWGPRGYFKAPYYTETSAHFASEIGYHGCPTRTSLERMVDPEFVHPWIEDHRWNDEWLAKSVRYRPGSTSTPGRNDIMIRQARAFFDSVPDDLDEFILASQICQAEALKFFIEFWRQQKGARRGILWWNLRDGWPIVSDAVVDYYNTKKLAFHYIQRAQRDVQAICCEASEGQHPIVVVNDTLHHVHGRLEIRSAGSATKLLDLPFEVEANGKAHVGELSHPARAEMWQLNWSTDSNSSWTSHYLAVSGPINLRQYKEWMKLIEL